MTIIWRFWFSSIWKVSHMGGIKIPISLNSYNSHEMFISAPESLIFLFLMCLIKIITLLSGIHRTIFYSFVILLWWCQPQAQRSFFSFQLIIPYQIVHFWLKHEFSNTSYPTAAFFLPPHFIKIAFCKLGLAKYTFHESHLRTTLKWFLHQNLYEFVRQTV